MDALKSDPLSLLYILTSAMRVGIFRGALKKESEQIKKETEQIRQETELLRRQNAKGRELLASMHALCYPDASSSTPAPSIATDSVPSLS